MTKSVEWALVIILVIVGSWLRLLWIDVYPSGLHGDEAWSGLEGQRILREGYIGLWSNASYGNPALIYYLVALGIKLLGSTVIAIRLPFALVNCLWLPFFYLTAKRLCNRRIALIALGLLITGWAPLALARRGELLALSFAFFPSLYFSLQAVSTRSWRHFLLAGLFTGLIMHTNQPFWLTIPILPSLYLLYCLRTGQWPGFKFVCSVALCFLVISPILFVSLSNFNLVFGRFGDIYTFSSRSSVHTIFKRNLPPKPPPLLLATNSINTVLNYFTIPSVDIRDYFVPKPIFDPFTSTLFAIGLFGLLYGIGTKNYRYLVLGILFCTFLTSNIFGVDVPTTRRSQPSVYLAYIIVGIGLDLIINRLIRFTRAQLVIHLIVFTLLYCLGAYHILTFMDASTNPAAKQVTAYPLTFIGPYLSSLPKQTYVYFYSDQWSYRYETLRYFTAHIPGEDRSHRFALPESAGSLRLNDTYPSGVFVLLPEYSQLLPQIQSLYPGGDIYSTRDPQTQEVLFTTYYLGKI